MSSYHPSHRRVRSGRAASGIRAGAVGVFAAATAIGLLTVAVPAQAAPACGEYKFNGDFSLNQSNGWFVAFTSYGPAASGRAVATNNVDKMTGNVRGGVQGRNVDFTIQWDSGPRGHYTGTVGDDALVHNGVSINQINADSANWDSIGRLECIAAPAPKEIPVPVPVDTKPQVPATAVLGAIANGPATLQAGLSGTYVVTVSNSGGVSAPVELFIIFAKKLEQTGQIRAEGGFGCEVSQDAGINASLRCTGPQVEPGAKFDIVVQGVGRTPGPGILLTKIGTNSNQKDVTIT